MKKRIVNSLVAHVEAKYPSMKEKRDGLAFYSIVLPFARKVRNLSEFKLGLRKIYGDPYVLVAIDEWLAKQAGTI